MDDNESLGRCVYRIDTGDVTANDVNTPPPPPPPPPAPTRRPTDPTGFSDDRFRFLGIKQFWRTPKQGGWTQAMSVPVQLDPGMEIDTDYHQSNERRGPRFHCCAGGATSPLRIEQIPAGFYVEIGGAEYYSAREPMLAWDTVNFEMGPFSGGAGQQVFRMTLYCGPPWDRGCEVNMKVWVVQRPKREVKAKDGGKPMPPTDVKGQPY